MYSSLNSTFSSGVSPFSFIQLPLGVNHSWVVYFRLVPSDNSYAFWTVPFPYEFTPTILPLYASFIAEARISDAEAEDLFIKTAIG